MSRTTRTRAAHRARLGTLAATSVLTLALAACAPTDEATDAGADPATSSADPSAGAGTDADTDAGTDAGTSPGCAVDTLPLRTAGTLTVGTDSPAYEPWFADDDPTNGRGFESALTYAVAAEMGFDTDQVQWVTVPFNSSYAPGPKNFDLDVNQISITPARAEVVDFSRGYYSASQAIIALGDNPVSGVTSVADLRGYSLGAQTGTTSLTAIRDTIRPEDDPRVFEDTNAAKQALLNGQVDAIVADLPTAFYITAAEIPRASIIGQFETPDGAAEEFGMLMEKGSGLVPCVDEALDALEADGTLAQLQAEWLSQSVDVPVLE